MIPYQTGFNFFSVMYKELKEDGKAGKADQRNNCSCRQTNLDYIHYEVWSIRFIVYPILQLCRTLQLKSLKECTENLNEERASERLSSSRLSLASFHSFHFSPLPLFFFFTFLFSDNVVFKNVSHEEEEKHRRFVQEYWLPFLSQLPALAEPPLPSSPKSAPPATADES